jgi:branched-chain amino acid aminotransferase
MIHDLPFSPPPVIWWDGRLVPWNEALVHVSLLQWSGVGSVFEGLRAYHDPAARTTHVFGLDAHLRRLERSMRLVGLHGHSAATLRQAVIDTVAAGKLTCDQYIRVFAWFEDGSSYTARQTTHAFVMSRAFASQLGRDDVSWTAGVSSWRRIEPGGMPIRTKAVANYMNGRLAGCEGEQRGFALPIQLNSAGAVAEGPRECVFLVRDGALVTPLLSDGVLDSITRRAVLAIAAHLDVPAVERTVQRGELTEADELFTCATMSEIVPVVSVDGVPLGDGRPGPLTRRIRQTYREVVYGKTPVLAEQRTAVGCP